MAKLRVKGKVIKTGTPPNFISAFGKEAMMIANEKTLAHAKRISAEAKEIIRRQLYDWEPLSEDYAQAKFEKGLDDRILMATRDYVTNGIGYWTRKQGKKELVFVGPRSGVHKPSGVPYQLIARWFEHGTTRMPARPLWRPLLSKQLRERKGFAKDYRAAVKRAFNERLKRAKKTTQR